MLFAFAFAVRQEMKTGIFMDDFGVMECVSQSSDCLQQAMGSALYVC
jgi:hypothetical protein